MIKLTQSLEHFLFVNYPQKLITISFGHIEDFTPEMEQEYIAWLKTEDGRSYLKGGSNYKEDRE